jgi:hypothetical protein
MKLLNWIISNKEWFFSGVGVAIIGFIIKHLNCKAKNQTINSGKNSTNIQGNNVKVSLGHVHNESEQK